MTTIFLHKLLPLFVTPLALVFTLLLIGLIRRSSIFVATAFIVLWVASTPLIASAICRFLEKDFQYVTLDDVAEADAIVVLSGMLSFSQSESDLIQEWGDPDRFFAGIDLLKSDKGRYLVFTGGKLPWSNFPSEGVILRERAIDSGVDSNSIIVTSEVANTAEEAKAIAQIASRHGFKRIILVTSSYHMSRAVRLFKKEGIRVFPYPVDFSPSIQGLNIFEFIPSARAFTRTSYAIRELLARAYYWWLI